MAMLRMGRALAVLVAEWRRKVFPVPEGLIRIDAVCGALRGSQRCGIICFTVATALLAAPADAHSWYTGQKNEKGHGCCGGQDCGPINPAAVKMVTPTHWQITIAPGDIGTHPSGGAIVRNFHGNPGMSPDGNFHACAMRSDIQLGTARCLFVGGSY
jgi:hypothetical protein